MKFVKLTVAEALLEAISEMGVEYVFMVPGAHIAPLYIALCERKKLKFIIAGHELEAAFMAIGYARTSNKPGVVLSIGAPGAAYMIGAAVTAKADNVPVIFITGDIPEKHQGLGEFHDASPFGTNDSAIFKEAIGSSNVCNTPEDIVPIIAQMNQCCTTRKPMHIQIPIDIQLANITLNQKNKSEFVKQTLFPPLIKLPNNKKIVFLIGYGSLDRIDLSLLKEFVNEHKIGIITDIKARGIYPEDCVESIGYIGFSSDPRALEVLKPSSLLAAESIMTIGVKTELVHQYIDASFDIVDIPVASFNLWMKEVSLTLVNMALRKQRVQWLTSINEHTYTEEVNNVEHKVSYIELFDVLNKYMPKETIYTLDSGQVRRAGNMFLSCSYPKTLIQSDTLSPMGSAICAGVGAKLSSPEKPVVTILGDGSMRMHGMAIATAARYNIPVIFILCDNNAYANILKSKELKEISDLPELDWKKYAESMGVRAFSIYNQEEFEKSLKEAILLDKPTLLWVSSNRLIGFQYNQTKVHEYKDWLIEIKEKFL